VNPLPQSLQPDIENQKQKSVENLPTETPMLPKSAMKNKKNRKAPLMPSERSMTITVHESQKTPTTVKDTIKAKKKKDKKAVPEKTNLNRFINSIFGSKPKKRSAETKKESEQDTQQIDEELKVKKRKKKFKK